MISSNDNSTELYNATNLTGTNEPSVSLHILLAEDGPDNILLIKAFLKKSVHQLDIAENGLIAVEKFRTNRYDIVLMDVQMPKMDGYAATAEIRRIEATEGRRRTMIIALTAHAFKEDEQRSIDSGCDRHITKPISKNVLFALLNAIPVCGHAEYRNKSDQKIIVQIDNEDILALIPEYLERRRKELAELRNAVAQKDFEVLQRLGHRMKGSGGGYGLYRIQEIGAKLEQSAKSQNLGAIEQEIANLVDYLGRVEVAGE